jgi:uncharacterized membrane protein YjgN (DUF898 family)
MIRSFIFRSRNTSFRGLHFDFHRTYKGFCKAYLAPFIVLIVLGWAMAYAGAMVGEGKLSPRKMNQTVGGIFLLIFLLVPVLLYRFKLFQFNHLFFGASRFESRLKLGAFYGICLRAFFLAPIFMILALLPVFVLIALAAGNKHIGGGRTQPRAQRRIRRRRRNRSALHYDNLGAASLFRGTHLQGNTE